MAATAAYRSQLLQLRAGTYRDLLTLWPAFDPDNPAAVAAWLSGARAVTLRDRARAAALTRTYLQAHALEEGVTVTPTAPAPLAREQVDTSLRVTSLVAYRQARGSGKLAGEALKIAAVRSSGAASRLALNGGRSVVQRTAQAGQIRGWTRVGTPQCNLCKTLLGRFYPPTTQAFKCHDHCACTFEPVYR